MNIDVFSDAICPWCWIGKRKLEQALALPDLEGITVTWRAYQLYPELPARGMDRGEFMTLRFGGGGSGRSAMVDRLQAEGKAVGLALNFDRAKRMPNTLSAHRLLRWAHVQGGGAAQDRLLEALFRRYFTEGEDLGDEAVLTNAVTEAGLDGAAAAAWLPTGEGTREVLHEVRWSRDNGISGVPCYVLPTGFGIPGAQDPETLARFLRRGLEQWQGQNAQSQT